MKKKMPEIPQLELIKGSQKKKIIKLLGAKYGKLNE